MFWMVTVKALPSLVVSMKILPVNVLSCPSMVRLLSTVSVA